MSRPRIYHFDPLQVLRGIADAADAQREAVAADLEEAQLAYRDERVHGRWQYLCGVERELKTLDEAGIEYHLPEFIGRMPTPSERIVVQGLIRQLEADGLVARSGRRIRVTREGRVAAMRHKRQSDRTVKIPEAPQ